MNDESENSNKVKKILGRQPTGAESELIFKNGIVPAGQSNFTNWVFPSDADFSGLTFQGPACFDHVRFNGKANFSNTKFNGRANFESAQFLNHAYFKGALFREKKNNDNLADFSNSKFAGPAVFKGSIFERRALFSSAKFFAQVNFKSCVFYWDAVFADIQISQESSKINNQYVSFEKCRFESKDSNIFVEMNFENARFFNNGKLSFKCAEFHCTGEASFMKAEFSNQGNMSFSSSIFFNNGGVSFEEAEFSNKGDVKFDFVEFENQGSIRFFSAIFNNHGSVSFEETEFSNKENVTFSNSRFSNKNDVSFSSAIFNNTEMVSFEEAEFSNNGDVTLSESNFENNGNVRFNNILFQNHGNVSFSTANFANDKDVTFETTLFENDKDIEFSFANFRNNHDVIFRGAKFHSLGDLSFWGTLFSSPGMVNFTGGEFSNKGDLWLGKLVFANKEKLIAKNMRFREEQKVDFNHCLFFSKEGTLFQGLKAPANGQLKFTKCLFYQNSKVDFSESNFKNTVFEGGKFNPLPPPVSGEKALRVVFDDRYYDNSSLWDSLLNGDKDIQVLAQKIQKKIKDEDEFFCEVFGLPERREKSWADEINDFNLEFSEKLIDCFHWLFSRKAKVKKAVPPAEDIGPHYVDFTDLSSESAKNLTFRLTNLSGARFDSLTLSHVQLNAPRWAEYDGRAALREEIAIREKRGYLTDDEYRDLSDQYTQLKINLERQGHYRDSGKFHISEQELTRDYNWKHGKYHVWLFHSLYKWLSGYGEQPFRAIACFAALLALFSTVIACMTTDLGAAPYTGWEWVEHGFVKILKTGLSLITPFKGLWFEHMTVENYGVYIVRFIGQVGILAIQLPLMILAIRRWFKR